MRTYTSTRRSLRNKLTITQMEFYASKCYTGVVEEAVNFNPDFKEETNDSFPTVILSSSYNPAATEDAIMTSCTNGGTIYSMPGLSYRR